MALTYRDMNLQVAPDCYIFTSPSSPNAHTLTIHRPTGEIRLNEAGSLSAKRVSRVSSIQGILGMIQLGLDKYLLLITKSQPVGRLNGHMIYRVIATEVLPMREHQIRDLDEDKFLSLLKTFIKSSPMYYSYSVDLTNSLQRQAQQDSTTPLWTRTDDRFFWNRFVQSDLIDFRNNGARGQPGQQPGIDPYILPVIYGVIEIHPTTFRETPITLALISRRSRFRGGTRYLTRGIDEEGHAANYNETEQVLILNDNASGLSGFAGSSDMQSGKVGDSGGKETQVLSYVQTRGSVPVYWAEVNNLHYTPKVQIGDLDASFAGASRHFAEQIRIYGENYLVNLVNQKGREKPVKDAYEQVVRALVSAPKERIQSNRVTDEKFHIVESAVNKQLFDRLNYIYFDFRAETKGLQMHRAMQLIDRMQDALLAQQYFRAVGMPGRGAIDVRPLEVRQLQTSVVRSNCMDCLDRTNVVQSMFARWTLDRMFVDLGLMQRGQTFRDGDPAFEFLFRNLWADNADTVSKSYSGTGAEKTDLTRMGFRTKAGALQDGKVAVTRYIKNNFFDGPRQDAFDLFLGAYSPATASKGSNLVFADRRPILIQAVPYVLLFSIVFIFTGLLTKSLSDSAVLPTRLFLLFCTANAIWSFNFIFKNGMLYVNWPKLNPRPWVTEGYRDTIAKVGKDKIVGRFLARHERGLSTARYLNTEEGKKRIE